MLAKHAKVMVVEDNEQVRNLLVKLLERAGCVTVTATNGEHAWLIAANDVPDLFLVDYHMPELDGAELIDRIRHARDSKLAKVPIIGITGLPDSALKLSVAGASLTLMKPLQPKVLIEAVRQFVPCAPC